MEGCDGQLHSLVSAVKEGNYETVKLLLQNGANVDGDPNQSSSLLESFGSDDCRIVGPDHTPPLMWAILQRNYEIIKLLLEHGASVEGGLNHNSLLHMAIVSGQCDVVKILLEHGASVTGGRYQKPFLETAIKSGQCETVRILLEHGASIERGPDKKPFLQMAIRCGQCEIVKILFEYGASIPRDPNYVKSLFAAVSNGPCEIVQLLLQQGAKVRSNSRYLHLLDISASKIDLETMKILLSYVLDFKSNDQLLQEGAETEECFQSFRHPQVIRHLLESCYCGLQLCRVDRFVATQVNNYYRNLIKVIAASFHPLAEDLKASPFWQLAGQDADSFRNKCITEVARMTTETIGNSEVSFFNILARDVCQVACYLKNSEIVEILSSEESYAMFPEYADILKCQFKKGKEWKVAAEEGIAVSHLLSTRFKELPIEIRERILFYLSVNDLINFKNACLLKCS